ncbi:MAG: hypothetical protein ACK4K0_09100 [Flavobacteriales bacterium]
MKNTGLNRISLAVILSLFLSILYAQDTTAIIIQQGDAYFQKQNYEKASYLYKLAARGNSPIFKEQIENKRFKSDSMLAHVQPINAPYTYLIKKADSLYRSGKMLLALKDYDKAYNVNSISEYPRDMIQRIISEDPSIQKQLMVLHSKKMKSEYDFRLSVAMAMVDHHRYFRAIEELDKIALQFADMHAAKLRDSVKELIKSEFESFSKALAKADELWMNRNYANAKTAYRAAYTINAECAICNRRMNYAAAEHHMRTLRGNDTLWLMNQLEEAAGNADFEAALVYLQYLKKENPGNITYYEQEQALEKAKAQQEARQEAQALVDKADATLKKGSKDEAIRLYRLVINYYTIHENLVEYAKMRLEELEVN